MKDKIFELATRGYEVSFRPFPGVRGTVLINLRKKDRQNSIAIDRVVGSVDDMLLWALDKLESSFGDQCQPVTFGEKRMALIRMEYPKNVYLERYFSANKIDYQARRDPDIRFNHVAFRYECQLTEHEFAELEAFLDIIK